VVAYYNEIDPYAAQWLRNLIAAGLIAPGDVDERSIVDVQPDDVRAYTQCHFFAGIGGWSYALRLAGWADDRPVWTGSCPCQPLSGAGQRKGHADERHLWPAFHRLIAECSPAIVFGEQVASADGREWLAGVRADLEALGYAVGAADLCAASVGAPQVRQRLYWLADATLGGSRPEKPGDSEAQAEGRRSHPPSSYRRFVDGFGNSYRIPQSSIPFLDDGFPGILDQIRAAGNAIVPQVAAEFIKAVMP
jgi:DNA (cytosine-5)-methyltransferase 1